jgi:AraC family transcriptional regulator of adaptative response/methylated-DNA-[protein]-cysteine methyltransferase
MEIRYGVARCALGSVIVATTERGLCAIELGDDPRRLAAQVRERFPKARLEPAGSEFDSVLEKVVSMIEAPGCGIELPLDIRGTAFQEQVWTALRRVPHGTTVSYGQIARAIGRPDAARAVAQACAANPTAVIISCHRAVRGDGKPGGYRWGVEKKRALLLRERDAAESVEATRTGTTRATASDEA